MKNNPILEFLWSYVFIMAQLIYLFLEPLIFSTVGLIFQVSWQYYLISIGGYYALTLIWEVLARLFQTENGKTVHPPFVRKLKKVMALFAQEAGKPAQEDN